MLRRCTGWLGRQTGRDWVVGWVDDRLQGTRRLGKALLLSQAALSQVTGRQSDKQTEGRWAEPMTPGCSPPARQSAGRPPIRRRVGARPVASRSDASSLVPSAAATVNCPYLRLTPCPSSPNLSSTSRTQHSRNLEYSNFGYLLPSHCALFCRCFGCTRLPFAI